MDVYSIPGKLTVTWDPEVRAIIDTWTSYSIPLEDLRYAVLGKGLSHAKAHGGIAWIVDSSNAGGIFYQEIHDFINRDVFPAFVECGIKYFLTVDPEVPVTRKTVETYKKKAGPMGLELIEVPNVGEAKRWLRATLAAAT